MEPRSVFRSEPDFLSINLMLVRGFGTLLVNGKAGPIAQPAPLVFADDFKSVETHIARASGLYKALLDGIECTILIHGPDGYISPDWYGKAGEFPTWNYAMIEVRGTAEILPEAGVPDYLDRLVASVAPRLAPKEPWSTEQLTAKRMRDFAAQVRALRINVRSIEGTWKLCQDKPTASREAAAKHQQHSPLGQHTDVLAALMVGGGVTGLNF